MRRAKTISLSNPKVNWTAGMDGTIEMEVELIQGLIGR
jgi:hypothetical protein